MRKFRMAAAQSKQEKIGKLSAIAVILCWIEKSCFWVRSLWGCDPKISDILADRPFVSSIACAGETI
jgi:hypothetical protein